MAAQLVRPQPVETQKTVGARTVRLERTSGAQAKEMVRQREHRVQLEAEIQDREGAGSDEQIALFERRRDDLRVERDALARETAVLPLLRDTRQAAEREARERTWPPC